MNCYSLHTLTSNLHEQPLSERPQLVITATCSTSNQTAVAARLNELLRPARICSPHELRELTESAQTATCCKSCQTARPATGCITTAFANCYCVHELSVYTNNDSLPELATWKNCLRLRELPQPTGNCSQLAGTTQLWLTASSTVKKKAVDPLIKLLPHFLVRIKFFIPFARACHSTLS